MLVFGIEEKDKDKRQNDGDEDIEKKIKDLVTTAGMTEKLDRQRIITDIKSASKSHSNKLGDKAKNKPKD